MSLFDSLKSWILFERLVAWAQRVIQPQYVCYHEPNGYQLMFLLLQRPLSYDIAYKNCQAGKIDFLFKEPVVVELVGQEYVLDHFTQFWTLRHPNLVRHCGTDKLWMDTMSFQELQV